eukprot:14913008-Ditylum_brightwellii.AAC.1
MEQYLLPILKSSAQNQLEYPAPFTLTLELVVNSVGHPLYSLRFWCIAGGGEAKFGADVTVVMVVTKKLW